MHSGRIVDSANLTDYRNGVQFLRDSNPKFRRYIWFVLVKVALLISWIIIYRTWREYNLTPTFTDIDLDVERMPIDYPSVFICPKDPVDYEKLTKLVAKQSARIANNFANDTQSREMFAQCLGDLARFRFERRFINDSCTVLDEHFPEFDIADALDEILIHCHDYIFNCTFKGHPIECCDKIGPLWTEHGHCYVFNNLNTNFNQSSLQLWSHDRDWKFAFNTHKTDVAIDIFLKDFDDIPSSDSRVGFQWQPNRISFVYINIYQNMSTADVRELLPSQRQCLFVDEKGPFTRLHSIGYHYNLCRNECHLKLFQKVCGCTPFFYKDLHILIKKRASYCTITQLICVQNYAETAVLQMCNCPKECNLITYPVIQEIGAMNNLNKVSKPDLPRDHFVLDLKTWPVKRFKTKVVVGWNKSVLPLGGLTGIFLGFSFLRIVELIYRHLFWFFCILWMTTTTKELGSDMIPIDSISGLTGNRVTK